MTAASLRWLALFLMALALSAAGGCYHSGGDNATMLGRGADSFLDTTGALSIEDVRRREGDLFAQPGAGLSKPAGPAPAEAALWLRFFLPDPDLLLVAGWNRPFAVTVKEPGIRQAALYLVRQNEVMQRTWSWQDGRRLDGKGYRYPILAFEPDVLRGATMYMRLTSNAPIRRNVWLSDFQSFFARYNAETTALSLAIGILLAVLTYILALGSTLKDRTNLWLAACIMAELVHIVAFSAVFETQFLPGAVNLSLALVLTSRLAVQATLIIFAKNFLRLSQNVPQMRYLTRTIAMTFGLMAVVAVFEQDFFVPAIPHLAMVTVGVLVFMCLVAARHTPRRTAAFVLCWVPTLVPLLHRHFTLDQIGFSTSPAFDDADLAGLCLSFVLFAVFASLEIRQREMALRRQILDNVDRFRGFAEIGTDGFWEVDARGRLTFLTGRQIGPAKLAVGEVLMDRLGGSASEDYVRPIRETIGGRLPLDGRRVRLSDGDNDTWISLSGRAIEDGGRDGTAVYRGVIRDVTEETEREARRLVEQRMLALGQLVGSVAHEVNNLIHPIVNLTKRLRNRQSTDPEATRLMDLIDLSSRQAAKVVSELLQSTRDQRWKEIDRPICLAVEYGVEAVRPALPASVKVDVVTEDIALPTVKIGDIIQIVGNLLSNAVHAMDGKGRISVALDALPEGARLTVSDDGAGMDESVRRRAMQPFFTTKSDGRGTGVGLYVVQKIVRDYGGWITIDSTPGLGTTFTILFPLRKDDDGARHQAPDGTRGG